MTPSPFLSRLQGLGIEFSSVGDKLHYKAPRGVITQSLLEEMSLRKYEIIASLGSSEASPSPLALRRRSAQGGIRATSFAQMRLWFLDQLAPNNSFYNVPAAIKLSGELVEEGLEWSLNEVVRRHEVLRTRFAVIDGQPVQVVEEHLEIKIEEYDLRGLPASERELEAQQLANDFSDRPFLLDQVPLIRACLIRLGEEERALVVVAHHIIADGWSVGILVKELREIYDSWNRGEELKLDELPIQYGDYAEWQRENAKEKRLEGQVEYWRGRLAGELPRVEIATDRARPAVAGYRGRRERIEVSKRVSEGLKTLSQREGVTLYTVMVAGLKVVLSRYTGVEDVIIGTAVSNRSRRELESMIGMFVNTVVLRSDLGGNPTFREVIRRVKESVLGAIANQEVPFERVVEELEITRDASSNPIFGVMFVMQNWPGREIEMGGLRAKIMEVESRTSKFDLLVEAEEVRDGIRVNVEYDVSLYEPNKIEKFLKHYETVLEEMCGDSSRQMWAAPLLTEQELDKSLRLWNATDVNLKQSTGVHQLFESQARRTPDAIAVVFENQRLTYRELNERANQLAHYLISLGVGPDQLVGICLDRSIEMVIAVLGILKAGGAYLPLDAAYPGERIRFMLKDACVSVVLADKNIGERIPESEAYIVQLDSDWSVIARSRRTNPGIAVFPDNLTYVTYTSGSTGRPKGIALSHGALVNLIQWHASTLIPGGRVLQFASISFDASFHEMFAAWVSGGTLFLVSEELRTDVPALTDFISRHEMSKVILPVVVLQQIAEEFCYQKRDFSLLREVITTGEQLQITRPVVKMFEALKSCSLHNHYGPSESHVVTYSILPESPAEWPPLPPIGRPIFNTQIYILDAHMNPVPEGIPGDLYIGGASLARGYINRPDLTAERFIPNPFGREPGGRLYATGDVARWLPDGEIEFMGRLDHQIKIRGFRVELGEIETVLREHPAVQEAVVTVREDSQRNKRLIGYVVPDRSHKPTTIELTSYLKKKLPDYMVPSACVLMEALPLTHNGKIDYEALAGGCESLYEPNPEIVAPRTPAEELVARVWSSVFEVNQVGIYDNFFEMGGHSLLATQIVLRLREVFRLELPLRTLFEQPTVDGLVNAMAQLCGGRETVEEIAWTFLQVEQLSDSDVTLMLAGDD